jgi:hypothetical protein
MLVHLILKYRVKIEINIIMDLNAEYINITNKISLKNKRNLILNETDKYMLSDYPITPENLEIIKTYRQQLRDFTQNNYIMPDKPDFINILNS